MYIKNCLASGLFSIASLFNICYADVGSKHTQTKVITRAAFDIGSGETKVTVADVDVVAQKVLNIKYQTFIPLNLRGDLEANAEGILSEKSVRDLTSAVSELQDQAKHHGAQESTGVASSVFRTAKNGSDVLLKMQQETGLTAVVLPQNEEGEVGFATAIAVSGQPKEKLVVWDSGSGSFQITGHIDGKMEVYGEEFASISAKKSLYDLRNIPFESAPINPVSFEEAIQLIDTIKQHFSLAPEWISGEGKHVVAIGGASIFADAATALNKRTFTKEDTLQLLIESCGKSNEELADFPTPKSAIVSLALLYAVMEHCKIKELTYYRTNGSTEGLLITPRFWKDGSTFR